MFAIIDVETTGHANYQNRITEIAIIRHDGVKVIETFESLVNPQCWIPSFITNLTGITNEMVRNAPTFEDIADEVRRLTKDAAFVAHNVGFDFTFVKNEFLRLDEHFEREKLCTVRLSRKIIPGFPSYSLGKICNSLKINHINHHRAMGDAAATVKLFEVLLKNDTNGLLKKHI
jgi:DNA polymerase III subunit epsilon